MKEKLLAIINRRIRSKQKLMELIYECDQEEDQKENIKIFKFAIEEMKSLKEAISKIK